MTIIDYSSVVAQIDVQKAALDAEQARRIERERIATEKAREAERKRAEREATQAEANRRWALAYRDEIVRRLVATFQKQFLKERFTVLDGPRRRIAIHLEAYIHMAYKNILGDSHNTYIKENVMREIARELKISYYNVRCEGSQLKPYKLPCEPEDCADAFAYAILGCIPYMCMGIGVLCEVASGRHGDRYILDLVITLD